MQLTPIDQTDSKKEIVDKIISQLIEIGFNITEVNSDKPWGAYIRISDNDIQSFTNHFFNSTIEKQDLEQTPKFLLVAPNQRLSWQYHHRRKELWSVLEGPIKVARGNYDDDMQEFEFNKGDLIELVLEERHRLIGTDVYGLVAEIWLHTDKNNPSNEDDIVRVQDDYGR